MNHDRISQVAVGLLLQRRRHVLNLKQREAAKLLNTSQSSLSKLERGEMGARPGTLLTCALVYMYSDFMTEALAMMERRAHEYRIVAGVHRCAFCGVDRLFAHNTKCKAFE